MKKEIIVCDKTVDLALQKGAASVGVDIEDVVYEVLEQPKKGFLGVGASDAKIKITYTLSPMQAAEEFFKTLISDAQLDVNYTFEEIANGKALLNISGENAGILIGHHGETLDALQFYINLVANKNDDDDYTKITVDAENYRAKREATLKALAQKTAGKVKAQGRSIAFEPMNPFERRIIHSEAQAIDGVTTKSIGEGLDRRVVMYPEKAYAKKTPHNDKKNHHSKKTSAPKTDAKAELYDLSFVFKTSTDGKKFEKEKDFESYFANQKN